MKRSEFFVTRGRGHWAKCRKEFRCEFDHGPRCLYRVKPGDLYLSTDVPLYPDAPANSREGKIQRRYCFTCAEQELTP
jgi:hypothetical protein